VRWRTACSPADTPDPEHEAVLADTVGLALLVVLDTLTPAERLAFVLHDTFGVPFEQVAEVLGRSTPAAKMLASRARRRVRAAGTPGADPVRQRTVVEAFLAASREGDLTRSSTCSIRTSPPARVISGYAARGPWHARRWPSRTVPGTDASAWSPAPRPSW
jgi:hypothetical protein